MNSEQFKQWCRHYNQTTSTKATKPLIMGVLNVTPDSFSDGGLFYRPESALDLARKMIAAGADLIDIGGESSRPTAVPVSCFEELDRVIPVIEKLRTESDICISIDTVKAEVMQAAVVAGASLINDITALSSHESLSTAAGLDIPVCLMHMQGAPSTMQDRPYYRDDVVDEVNAFFQQRIHACIEAGIKHSNLIIDPGFGYGKTVQHNLRLVNKIASFHSHQRPVLLGVSRKSTLGAILNKPVNERLLGGLAMAVFAASQGVAIIRTHDVEETKQALITLQAIKNEE